MIVVILVVVLVVMRTNPWPTQLDANATRHDGFKTTFFFTGSASLAHHDQWTSQSHQDELISSIFKGRKGFFLDIAANDAKSLSNSYSLERNFGWNGVCVEANPIYFWGLVKRKCTPVFAVVADIDDREVNFTLAGVFGGIAAKNLRGLNTAGFRTGVTTFRTTTVDMILQRTRAPRVIDYLSLDIEGAEYLALKNFAFKSYVFLTITIERPTLKLRRLLSANGYVYLWCFADYGETVWVHDRLLGEGVDHDGAQIPSKSDVLSAFSAMRAKVLVHCTYNLPDKGIKRMPGIEYPRGDGAQRAPGA